MNDFLTSEVSGFYTDRSSFVVYLCNKSMPGLRKFKTKSRGVFLRIELILRSDFKMCRENFFISVSIKSKASNF